MSASKSTLLRVLVPALAVGAAVLLPSLAWRRGASHSHATTDQKPVPVTHANSVASSAPSDIQEQRQSWREEQDALMRSERSPLCRIDYIHLPPGEHAVSTDAGATLRVPADSLSSPLGRVRLQVSADGRVRLSADPAVRLDGSLVAEAVLHKGSLMALGLLRLLFTGSETDPAIAVYDLGALARREYQGLHYFPDDDRFRVRARLQRYPQAKTAHLSASRGDDKDMSAIGVLHFALPGGVEESMEAYLEQAGSSRLFLIFRDGTSGKPDGSYGAGRFLYAQLGSDDTVWLDFNQAWNPLCAYSAYFHCPLPPRSNWLKTAIPVGEKVYAAH